MSDRIPKLVLAVAMAIALAPSALAANVAADTVLSASVKEADNTASQDTNSGSGIKTNHIQNGAVTSAKIADGTIVGSDLANGAVTDAKIAGPISASKIEGGVFQNRYAFVVTVAKSGGDFADPVAALASITGASASSRYLVKVMPGVYDVGAASVQLKAFVDLEGSGEGVTVVSGTVADTADGLPTVGVVNVEYGSELRSLTVEHRGGAGYGTAVRNLNGSMRDVTATATGSGQNTAVSTQGGLPVVNRVTAVVANGAGQTGYGFFNRLNSRAKISGARVTVTGGAYAVGFWNFNNFMAGMEIADTAVTVDGASTYGGPFENYDSFVAVRNSTFTVTNSASSNGMYNYDYACTQCKITIEGSAIVGGANVVANHAWNPLDNLFIANTKLAGGPLYLTSRVKCTGTYDGTFSPLACP